MNNVTDQTAASAPGDGPMFSEEDRQYMLQALALAELGLYSSMPNPRVGCVIVKDGVILGRGAHLRAGEAHAEVHALREAGARARGADVYVTLEPCNHQGRTPPCSEALLSAGVRRVYAAMQDPNPKVAGTGLAHLQNRGIEVATGLLAAEARALNAGFVARMERGMPHVCVKIAASLDGRTALHNGVSQWLTGATARDDVQRLRARSCAILTGIGTVLLDDPQLNVRNAELLAIKLGQQPLRVVVDSQLRTPPGARILQNGRTLIAHAGGAEPRQALLVAAGAELLCLPDAAGQVDLQRLLRHLAALEINELLVEAGQGIDGALQRLGLIDEYVIYYAPLLLGSSARGMFTMPALESMSQRAELEIVEVTRIGQDIRLRARSRR